MAASKGVLKEHRKVRGTASHDQEKLLPFIRLLAVAGMF